MPKVREICTKKGSSMLEAARECVLTKKFPPLHEKVITEFLRKFEVWSSDQRKYFRKGENAAKSVTDILRSGFFLRWNSIHIAVARLSNSAAGYDSLYEFISAIRLEGDFVEDSGGFSKESSSGEGSSGNVSSNLNENNNYQNRDENDNDNEQDQDDNSNDEKEDNYNNNNNQNNNNNFSHKINLKLTKNLESGPSSSQNPQNPKLTIWVMAMHAAKGLEFNEVILPFWSKGTMMDKELPSERKIAFMSLTRAKERVMISYSKSKKLNGMHYTPTGASLFVESLLQIPGLKMTHEDISMQTQGSIKQILFSDQNNINNYFNKNTNSNSNSNSNVNSNTDRGSDRGSDRNTAYNAVRNNDYDNIQEMQNKNKYSGIGTDTYTSKYGKAATAAAAPNVQIVGTAGTLLRSKASSSSLTLSSPSPSPSPHRYG